MLADAHFPTSSICLHGPKEIRADGKSKSVSHLHFIMLKYISTFLFWEYSSRLTFTDVYFLNLRSKNSRPVGIDTEVISAGLVCRTTG